MKKFKFRYFLLIMLIIPCFFLSGCFDKKVYVTSIKFDSVNGNVTNYTVTYSDNTTSTLSVTNGEDGSDVTIEQIFEACVTKGMYTNDDAGFNQFLKDYLQTTTNSQQTTNYRAMQSIVGIYCAFEREYVDNSIFGHSYNNFDYYEFYTGSGIIYDMDEDKQNGYTYILTNSHVVNLYESNNAKKLPEEIVIFQYGANVDIIVEDKDKVVYGDEKYALAYNITGDIVSAECIGYEVEYDTAVIRVKTSELLAHNSNFRVADFSTKYNMNDKVVAIGNPLGNGVSVTEGEISYPYDKITIENMPADNKTYNYDVIRFDAPIYGGNSGGGLFNTKGEVIGLVNAGLNDGDNYNSAIPIQSALNVAKNLRYYYTRTCLTKTSKINASTLGITVGEKNFNFNDQTGELTYDVYVKALTENSIAYNCGLRKDDVITKVIVDGEEFSILHGFEFDSALINVRANSNLTLVLKTGANVNITGFTIK